jgi:hypothetical protein
MQRLAPYLRHRAAAIWAVLVIATVLAWILGSDHGLIFTDATAATVLVIAIAFIKVQLIGAHFMELQHAPHRLAFGFTAWILITCTIITAVYLAG